MVASALVGCMVGALMAGTLSDRFGRKAILIVSAVLFLVSAIGCMVPPTITLLIFARWLGGVGIGIASMLSPMYLSEVSPPHLRGRLITLYQLAITIGIVVAYFSNECLQWLSTNTLADMSAGPWRWILVDEVWRGMFGAATLPSLAFSVTVAGGSRDAAVVGQARADRRGARRPDTRVGHGGRRELKEFGRH